MSARHIQHVYPEDGTTHVPVECYCHPEIHEANGWSALAGLEDLGVEAEEEGALVFVHNKAAETSRWTIAIEQDDEETD